MSSDSEGSDDNFEKKPKRERKLRIKISSDSEESIDNFEKIPKRKRKLVLDSEDEWVPITEEPSSVSKKKIKSEQVSPSKKPRLNSPAKSKLKREPKEKVKREPKEKVKREPKVKVKREPKVKVKREPKIKVKKEPIVKEEKEKVKKLKQVSKDELENQEELEDVSKIKSEVTSESRNDEPSTSKYTAPGSAWKESDLLAEMLQVENYIANNIVRLLESDNTIPFIARYRRDMVGDMTPEELRHAKDAYETVKNVQAKAVTILKAMSKSGKLTDYLEKCIVGARSIDELEYIYTPYKVGSKRSKAEVARQLGLEEPAICILKGTQFIALEPLINENIPGLENMQEVESGVVHITADIISKDMDVLNMIRKMIKQEAYNIRIESSQSRSVKGKETKKPSKANTEKSKTQNKTKEVDVGKYQHYFEFSNSIKNIKPHQVLALNRGESQKVLSVKVSIPQWLINNLELFCFNHWLNQGYTYPLRKHIFQKSFKDSYNRLIFPFMARTIRSELNRNAESAAVEVFATNLKKLLLQPPLRGFTILAIDPGYRNGCKAAMITSSGSVLETDILYLHPRPAYFVPHHKDQIAKRLRDMLLNHKCETIALGNGTACRETELYLGELIQSGWFRPLDVKYTIVSEQGASIYSCSPEASKEFPNLDPNLVSAVSLGRRIQDPLSELVKVEPKHLGVGMYQHDVSEKLLNATLDEVVSECVSFVGVDINTASLSVLRRIAGLNITRANKILEWREASGPFTNRQQLRLIKGIGDKTYEQCAGFVRIVPETIPNTEKKENSGPSTEETGKWPKKHKTMVETEFNILDQTVIHPESYSTAMKLVSNCGVNITDLGTTTFINRIGNFIQQEGLECLVEKLNVSKAILNQICEGLLKPPDYDIRSELSQPLFRREITTLDDLQAGIVLTGRVQNVTHFGTFVDIGVGTNGLIHTNRLGSIHPQFGDRVEVKILNVEIARKRIGLELVRLI